VKAIGKGLQKVMSKMGISTYMSYTGAQIFEAVGLNRDWCEVLHRHRVKVEGIGIFEVARRRCAATAGLRRDPVLAAALEPAASTPTACAAKSTCGRPTRSRSCSTHAGQQLQTYKEYAQIINDQSRRHMTLRGLFEFRVDPGQAIPLDEVEPAEIVKRFVTGAMSLGSISTEAHATLAVAMNRIGGKSNTGEGGEDERATARDAAASPIRTGDTLRPSSAPT
jgi:glutamate synthase (NADPH/NADH) large chain